VEKVLRLLPIGRALIAERLPGTQNLNLAEDDILHAIVRQVVEEPRPAPPRSVALPGYAPQPEPSYLAPYPQLIQALPVLPNSDPPTLGDSNRPQTTTITELRQASLADLVVLISSVSGGSLATAYHLHRNYPHYRSFPEETAYSDQIRSEPIATQDPKRDSWRSTYRRELFLRMRDKSRSMLEAARTSESRVGAVPVSPVDFLQIIGRVNRECEQLGADVTFGLKLAPWLPRSAAVDDMGTDFMAPLLRGLLDPGQERGDSVTRFWEDRFGWNNVGASDLHYTPLNQVISIPPEDKQGVPLWPNDAPMALFNACDVEQGSRLIIGFPPLPPGLCTDPLAHSTRKGPYSLSDRGDLYYRVNLAEAVRLSANFPWGFEVAQLSLRGGNDRRLILDGGIVDNSGIDSLVHVLRGLNIQAQAYQSLLDERASLGKIRNEAHLEAPSDPLSRATSLQRRSHGVMKELRRRGVLLVQIDSGAKDIGTDRTGIFTTLASLAPALFRPLQALNNASYTNADLATVDYDLVLDAILQPPPEDRPRDGGTPERPAAPCVAKPPLVRRVRLTCNNSENVMTAWSLGPADKAQVIVQFLIEWTYQQQPLVSALKTIQETAAAYRAGDCDKLAELEREYRILRKGQVLDDYARKQFYGQTALVPENLPPQVPRPGADTARERIYQDIERSFKKARDYGAIPGTYPGDKVPPPPAQPGPMLVPPPATRPAPA
jgi:hypothetical protein